MVKDVNKAEIAEFVEKAKSGKKVKTIMEPQKFPRCEMRVRMMFTEEILGSLPSNPEIFAEFIASQSPDAATREEEISAMGVAEVVQNGRTIFTRCPKTKVPCLRAYQIRGFFKSAASTLRQVAGMMSSELTAQKKLVDTLIFINEDYLEIQGYKNMGICERPLRADTAQGPRVSLASSESIPAGAYVEFTVVAPSEYHLNLAREWLNYGEYNGMSQWRNSGKGRFVWEEIEKSDENVPKKGKAA